MPDRIDWQRGRGSREDRLVRRGLAADIQIFGYEGP
jgi:hypothetical protein